MSHGYGMTEQDFLSCPKPGNASSGRVERGIFDVIFKTPMAKQMRLCRSSTLNCYLNVFLSLRPSYRKRANSRAREGNEQQPVPTQTAELSRAMGQLP